MAGTKDGRSAVICCGLIGMFSGIFFCISSLDVQKKRKRMQYLTDMENSPGALSLSRTRKAPHSLCLSRLSATQRDIRPANHLERRMNNRKVRNDCVLLCGAFHPLFLKFQPPPPPFPRPDGDNNSLDLTATLKKSA